MRIHATYIEHILVGKSAA